MKYRITREKYERYGSGGIIVSTFEAEDDVDALYKVHDNCLYGIDEDDEQRSYTKEQLIDKLYDVNGDGCDYILKLENLDTKEVLVESDDIVEQEEDW